MRARRSAALARDKRGVAFLEFALGLPLFLGMTLTALEFGNFVMATNRVQRMAAMTSDLVAQSGTGEVGISEKQIYDLFNAVDLTAKPYDLRNRGRVIITGVQGTDKDNNGTIDNTILWQRFDGAYVQALPVVGCAQTVAVAALPNKRSLLLDEVLFHVQVSYNYEPLFTVIPFGMLDIQPVITKSVMFRARSKDFTTPNEDSKFPPKKNCTTATGL
ncbi:TadE/TadG family type IV pilus assembly protein [uncultured Sphingomonas sp.]|uniref:TadE/TadG family type IV pilus assembly protein n=1 Tax=uncultured Sphingomonas sp. TaxID=158754 RepID=UPI002621FB20|nr:TadE/TadG family type IV pilus assembly protein [uncultured Sphingomonas sp.]